MQAFSEDVSKVVARARAVGVERMVVPGVDLASSRRAVELAREYEEVYATVGFHPHHVTGWVGKSEREVEKKMGEVVSQVRELAEGHEKVVAIGEVGLDYYVYQNTKYEKPDITEDVKRWQRELLEKQLELAVKVKLPVVLHTRESMKEAMKVVGRYREGLVGGVWHCFGGNLAQAKQVLTRFEKFYIGIDGNVSYKNRKFDELRKVAKLVPLDRLVVETDAPYLAPEPKRGQRCEPGDVKLVAEYLAKLRGEEVERLVDQTGRNGQAIFARMS